MGGSTSDCRLETLAVVPAGLLEALGDAYTALGAPWAHLRPSMDRCRGWALPVPDGNPLSFNVDVGTADVTGP